MNPVDLFRQNPKLGASLISLTASASIASWYTLKHILKDINIKDDSKDRVCNVHYDIVVQCDRLVDLNEAGWNVQVKKDVFCEELLTQNDKRFKRVVAVSGMYNTGKTFVLNNLAQTYRLPEGFDVHTEGLSIKRLPKPYDDVLLLDTAGTNSAIKIANDEALSDKISCERILSNVLNDLADFHICVVNRLTWQDQRHYEELYHEIDRSYKSSGPKSAAWPLFIVHNFREHNLDELETLVKEIKQYYPDGQLKVTNFENKNNDNNINVEKIFLSEVEQMKKSYKQHSKKILDGQSFKQLKREFACEFWFDSKGNGNVRHLFLVKNEGAGTLFNWRTLEYLRTTIHNSPPTERGFGLGNVVKALDKHVKKYCTFKNMDKVVQNSSEVLTMKENLFNENKDSEVRNLTISLSGLIQDHEDVKDDKMDEVYDSKDENKEENKNKIILKKPHELAYNTLFSIATEWRPRCDIIYANDECLIVAEIPGTLKERISIQANRDTIHRNVNIKFSGIREYELCYYSCEDKNIQSSDDSRERRMGRFDCSVVVSPEYYLPQEKLENSWGGQNGVYWVKLSKLEQQNTWEIQ